MRSIYKPLLLTITFAPCLTMGASQQDFTEFLKQEQYSQKRMAKLLCSDFTKQFVQRFNKALSEKNEEAVTSLIEKLAGRSPKPSATLPAKAAQNASWLKIWQSCYKLQCEEHKILQKPACREVISEQVYTDPQLLCQAARYCSTNIATLCLAAGADPNQANPHGDLPLLNAAEHAPLSEMLALLLEYGANPNTGHRSSGMTPLHHTAHHGNFTAVCLLLAGGAEIDATSKHKITPLMCAVGNPTIIALLMRHGADATATNQFGKTAWHWAIDSGYHQSLEELARRGGVDLQARKKSDHQHLPAMIAATIKRQKQFKTSNKLPNDIVNLIFALEGSPSIQDVGQTRVSVGNALTSNESVLSTNSVTE